MRVGRDGHDGLFHSERAQRIVHRLKFYVVAGYANVQVATHEAGHNLRLQHAQTRDFGTEALGPLATPGVLSEYGDEFSTMGNWIPGHYAASQKAQILGWMAAGTDYQTVQTSGTYTIQPLEMSSGMRALEVQRGTGNAWLWIEYRQPAGNYDTSFNTTQPYSGAVIHYEDSTTGAFSQLLDFTPVSDSNEDFGDPALAAGKSWVDPYTNLSLTVNSATSNALNVTVSYGAAPCTHANPGVSLSPPNLSVGPVREAVLTTRPTLAKNDSAGTRPLPSLRALPCLPGTDIGFFRADARFDPDSGSTTMALVSTPAGAVAATYPVGASHIRRIIHRFRFGELHRGDRATAGHYSLSARFQFREAFHRSHHRHRIERRECRSRRQCPDDAPETRWDFGVKYRVD